MPGQVPTESSIPNFLLKLWRLVEDEQFQNCIRWDETGYSFHVCEPYVFSKSVLPLYFKHSNLNSFIRQLNMYGFRKVTNFDKGSLKQSCDMPPQQQQNQDTLEFQHPYFVRGHVEMLQYIKRKVAASSRTNGAEHMDQSSAANCVAIQQPAALNGCPAYHSQGSIDSAPLFIGAGSRHGHKEQENSAGCGGNGVSFSAYFLEDMRQMRDKTSTLDVHMCQLRKENQALWNEIGSLRQTHRKQQALVNNLIQILSTFATGQQQNKARQQRNQLLAIGPSGLERSLSCDSDNDLSVDENLATTLKISDVTHEYETKVAPRKTENSRAGTSGYNMAQYGPGLSMGSRNIFQRKQESNSGYHATSVIDENKLYSGIPTDTESAMETDWATKESTQKHPLIEFSPADTDGDYDANDINKLKNSLSTAGQFLKFDTETVNNLFMLAENSNQTAKSIEEEQYPSIARSALLPAPSHLAYSTPVQQTSGGAPFFQRQTSVPCYVSYACPDTSQTVSVAVGGHQQPNQTTSDVAPGNFNLATIPDNHQTGSQMNQTIRRSSTPLSYSCQMSVPLGVMVGHQPYESTQHPENCLIGSSNSNVIDSADDFSSFILSHFDSQQNNSASACSNDVSAGGFY